MYRLFARAGSGSAVVEALLEEAGADYEIVPVERGTAGPQGFLNINPLGQVPALVLPDGTVMTESAAITIYLADLYPQLDLAPAQNSPLRPVYLRWMVYLAANVYMTDLRIYYSPRYSVDSSHANSIKAAAEGQMAREWEVFARALGAGPYVLGNEPSAVDIYAAMLSTWNTDVPAFFHKHPNIRKLYDLIAARPAVARVWKRNDMNSWMDQAASA